MQVLLEQTWTVSTEKLQYNIQYNIVTKKDAILDKLDQTCLGLTNFFHTDNFQVKTLGKQSTKTMKICFLVECALVECDWASRRPHHKRLKVLKADHLKLDNNMVIAAISLIVDTLTISQYSNSCALLLLLFHYLKSLPLYSRPTINDYSLTYKNGLVHAWKK